MGTNSASSLDWRPGRGFQSKVAETATSEVKLFIVQVSPEMELQPDQPPNVPRGVAVSTTVVPVAKVPTHTPPVLAQLIPAGWLLTVPAPVPAKSTVTVGPEPPPLVVLVKQVTFAVIKPVTIAPDECKPDPSAFVVTVAEISVPPQVSPVVVARPVEFTVTICVSFDVQVT
jgi:hypothetical protein